MDAQDNTTFTYLSQGGIRVTRRSERVNAMDALSALRRSLDAHRGALLTSGFEYPGRYSRWALGFEKPALSIEGRGRDYEIKALNARGLVLLPWLLAPLARADAISAHERQADRIVLTIAKPTHELTEEERTRRPSPMSLIRVVRDVFAAKDDAHAGLYGAFGYDLVFALDALRPKSPRSADQRDLVLYLPDELLVIDHRRECAERVLYDFSVEGRSTADLPREGSHQPYRAALEPVEPRDHAVGEYAALVGLAKGYFARGELFEVTPSQVFRRVCRESPATLFEKLCRQNPAPYGFLINLGEQEYLVGASPEMYVRVEGRRVETCPIAGTIARGVDAMDDALQIRKLLTSSKEESELTMCTDVDRNDKARICEPGSVRVIGRRQLELYSRLIHTVDHVEGRLREDYDALDAFMTHLWAVTVSGAPKLAAMQFIEDHERSPRRFYAGAVGCIGFDGHLNTGLTLRTMRIAGGVAEVRAGATLLFESDPQEEEKESELKAAALLALLEPDDDGKRRQVATIAMRQRPGLSKRVLLVDCHDSFVHTLADYFRQAGAEVSTQRPQLAKASLARERPELCVLSPGPGRPADFELSALLGTLMRYGVPTFGVCLGLQAMVEYCGGSLGQLAQPVHGQASRVSVLGGRIFAELPAELVVGRYHSLYGERASFPAALSVTAETADAERTVMAIEHRELPLHAVQFHPESILSAQQSHGLTLVHNVLRELTAGARATGLRET